MTINIDTGILLILYITFGFIFGLATFVTYLTNPMRDNNWVVVRAIFIGLLVGALWLLVASIILLAVIKSELGL